MVSGQATYISNKKTKTFINTSQGTYLKNKMPTQLYDQNNNYIK